MKNIFTLFLFLSTAFLFQRMAVACSCLADPLSKTYQLYQKTWYGTKRHWSCDYQCTNAAGQSQTIIGYHKNWYLSDRGLEGICDGLVYKSIYAPHSGNFIWTLDKATGFNPKKSTSPDLVNFAKTQCQ